MCSRLPVALLLSLLFSGLCSILLQELTHDLHHLTGPGWRALRRHDLLSSQDLLFDFLEYLAVLLLKLLELRKSYACCV